MYGTVDPRRPGFGVATVAIPASVGCTHLVSMMLVFRVLEALDTEDTGGVVTTVTAAVGWLAVAKHLATLRWRVVHFRYVLQNLSRKVKNVRSIG